MNAASFAAVGPGAAAPEPSGWRAVVRAAEDWVLVVPLLALMALPLTEIVLRRFHTGISGATSFVQHFTLIVGMLGGAIAARERRLLSFSTLASFFTGKLKTSALILSSAAAAAIAALLCAASVQFVISEKGAGGRLAYGIPLWIIELALPLGFGLIALRLVWHSSADPGRQPGGLSQGAPGQQGSAGASLRPKGAWKGRLLSLGVATVIVSFGAWSPIAPEKLLGPALACLVATVLLGAPVFTGIGGAALILFWADHSAIAAIPLKHYSLVTHPALPTIPLFTLAGYFLAESGASTRLVSLFEACFGSWRGGPAIATTLVCAFFTSFTGASGVTILALGGLLLPILRAANYSEKSALGLLTGAGSLGLLFPPCLPVILYSIIASTAMANLGASAAASASSVTMEKMFAGGLLPGVLMLVLTAWWGVRQQSRQKAAAKPFSAAVALRALWQAKWELLLPVIALVALFGGFATPVEAAAIVAVYALLITTCIHRDLRPLKDVPRVIRDCGMLVGGVLLILGVALGFTHYLVSAQVPDNLVDWSTHVIKSKWLFLLGLNLVLLIVGGLIEIYAAIVVVVPLLVPVGVAFGLDPVHLGIIFLANMELGFLAPPIGLNLLLSSYRFNVPILQVMRAAFPMLCVLLVGVLLITYFPPLTTWLPGLLK